MPKHIDWKERIEEKSDDATTFTLKHSPVPWGQRWCAQRVAVMNEDNNYDELRIAIRRTSYDHMLEQQADPQEDTWYWLEDAVYLMPSEYLVIRMDGTTVDDKCKAHITGYKEKLE